MRSHQVRLSRYQATVLRKPVSKCRAAPAELALDLRGVDGVAQIVAGPVGRQM